MHSTVSELVVVKLCHTSAGWILLIYSRKTKERCDSKRQVVNNATSAGKYLKTQEMQVKSASYSLKKKESVTFQKQ